jgi:hypothetical protein
LATPPFAFQWSDLRRSLWLTFPRVLGDLINRTMG